MDLVSRRGMGAKPSPVSSALPDIAKMSHWEFINWYLARTETTVPSTPFTEVTTPVQKMSLQCPKKEVFTPVQRNTMNRLEAPKSEPYSVRRSARLQAKKSPRVDEENGLDYIHGHEYREGRLCFWIVENVNRGNCLLSDGEEIVKNFPAKVKEYEGQLTRKTSLPILEKDQRGRRRSGAFSPFEQW